MTHCSSAGRPVVVLALVALAVAAAHAGLEAAGQAPAKEIIEHVLVKVNGDIITQTRSRGAPGGGPPDAAGQHAGDDRRPAGQAAGRDHAAAHRGRGGRAAAAAARPRARRQAHRRQVQADPRQLKKDNKIETEEQFQAALKSENLTMADLRLRMEKGAIINEVQNRRGVRADPGERGRGQGVLRCAQGRVHDAGDDDAARDPDCGAGEQARVQRGAGRGGQGEGRRAARQAQGGRELREGGDRGVGGGRRRPTAASSGRSACRTSRPSCSRFSRRSRSATSPRFSARRPATRSTRWTRSARSTELPWEQAREQIDSRVGTAKQEAEFTKYLMKARSQAVIEWKNAELKKLYDQRVAFDLAARTTK